MSIDRGKQGEIAAFIDLDGTLCKTFLWQALIEHHKEQRFRLGTLYMFMAYHMPLWLLYLAKLIPRLSFYRLHATNLAWLVRGVTVERGDEIWNWIIENRIEPNIRPEMEESIREHKARGERVILNSGSFTPLLEGISTRMGLERPIATPLAVKNGRYSGRIIKPLNLGEGKRERLEEYLTGPGKHIDMTASFFYTDSFVDIPVLEMFGNPIAVYPDPELGRLAKERGWKVIGEIQENR